MLFSIVTFPLLSNLISNSVFCWFHHCPVHIPNDYCSVFNEMFSNVKITESKWLLFIILKTLIHHLILLNASDARFILLICLLYVKNLYILVVVLLPSQVSMGIFVCRTVWAYPSFRFLYNCACPNIPYHPFCANEKLYCLNDVWNRRLVPLFQSFVV